MKENKRKNHGDFFKFFKKEYPDIVEKMGKKWNTNMWDIRFNSFNIKENSGWKNFVNSLPEPINKNIHSIVFEFLTEPLDLNSLMEKTQNMVNCYWNKIVVTKNISTEEERRFKKMMNSIKDLSELCKLGTLRVSPESYSINLINTNAEHFEYSELPPNSNLIINKVYPTNYGYWWELLLSIDNKIGIIYFKANEIKKVPPMVCTFQDGVFMAIPSTLMDKALTQKFTKLIGDNSNGNKSKGGTSKKKIPLKRMLDDMDFEELVQVVEDHDLTDDIDIEEYEGDEDGLQNAIMQALGI